MATCANVTAERPAPRAANGTHQAATIAEARRLYDGGWNPAEIGRILGVSRNTVVYWVHPRDAARQRLYQKRERRARRIRALIDGGLTYQNVAKVMAVDTGEEWTVAKIRWTLRLDQ